MREMKDSGIEWIGKIPRNYRVSKIKYLFSISSGTTPKTNDPTLWDGEFEWVTPADFKTEDVYVSAGHRKLSQQAIEKGIIQLVPAGSIIFSKRAPIGQVVINSKDLCINQGCLAIVSKDSSYVRYYRYAMISAIKQFELLGSGTTFMEISASNFSKVVLPLPDVCIQHQIADYLDSKCSQIDAIISKQEKIIEKLKEYKLSVITEAVTKGLNSNVEMKDSGVDFILKIPTNWNVSPIRYLFSLREEKNYKQLQDVNLLSLYTDLGVFPHGEQEERGNKAVTAEGYKVVYKDDIVVNIILAWMGAIGMSDYNGVTSPAYDVYKPQKNVCSRFYHYLFRTKLFSGECYKYGRGIMEMRWRTYSSEFKSIKVPVPSYDEQRQIADYLDSKCSQIDKTIFDRMAAIDKLREYKKSLIYEVVTGKREV
jgi:type I restriction enzyme S subunit